MDLKNTRGNNSHIGENFQRSLYSSYIVLLKFSAREPKRSDMLLIIILFTCIKSQNTAKSINKCILYSKNLSLQK